MTDDKFETWKGKKIFLLTKSGRKYSGVVKETTENFIFILDKFGERVVINISEIGTLEEDE